MEVCNRRDKPSVLLTLIPPSSGLCKNLTQCWNATLLQLTLGWKYLKCRIVTKNVTVCFSFVKWYAQYCLISYGIPWQVERFSIPEFSCPNFKCVYFDNLTNILYTLDIQYLLNCNNLENCQRFLVHMLLLFQ